MYYEINVAKADRHGNYHHLFATHERSCNSLTDLREALVEIKKRFPEPAFHITVSERANVGKEFSDEQIAELLKG